MTSSTLSKDITVTKFPLIADRIPFKSNFSLPVNCYNYSIARTRNKFDSFLISFKNFNPPCFWCKLSNNNAGSLCELFRVEECIFDSILKICGTIRHLVVNGEIDMSILKDNWRSFIAK